MNGNAPTVRKFFVTTLCEQIGRFLEAVVSVFIDLYSQQFNTFMQITSYQSLVDAIGCFDEAYLICIFLIDSNVISV